MAHTGLEATTMDLDAVNDTLDSRGFMNGSVVHVTPDGGYLVGAFDREDPDSGEFAIPDREGFVLDVATGEETATFPVFRTEYRLLDPVPAVDGSALATYDGDEVEVRRIPDGEVLYAFPAAVLGQSQHMATGAVGAGGRYVYLACGEMEEGDEESDGMWVRFDATTGELVRRYPEPAENAWGIAFAGSTDGSTVAVGGHVSRGRLEKSGVVGVYDAVTGDPVDRRFTDEPISNLDISPDGTTVVYRGMDVTTPGIDMTLYGPGWEVRSESPEMDEIRYHRGPFFVRGDDAVLVATNGGHVHLRDVETGDLLGSYEIPNVDGAERRLLDIATDADASRIFVAVGLVDDSGVDLQTTELRVMAPDWSSD